MEVNGDVSLAAGELLEILFGDGESPEQFTASCLINTTREVSWKSNLTETEVANCLTPSAPAKIIRKVKSIDFTVTGAGKTDRKNMFTMIQWWESGEPKNCKVRDASAAGDGGWIGAGQMILSDFKDGGARGDYRDFTGTFTPAGTFVWAEAE